MSSAAIKFDPATHAYTVSDRILPSVTQVIQDAGLMGVDKCFFTAESRDRGTAVHRALQYLDENDLDRDSVPESIRGYVTAWERFKEETGFVPEMIETPLYDEKLGVCGTPDRIGKFHSELYAPKLAVVDIKTGQPAPWHAIQLAAYMSLANLPTAARVIVHVKADGKYSLERIPAASFFNDRNVFLSALNIWKWKRMVA